MKEHETTREDVKPYDVTGAIIAFEMCDLDDQGCLELFAYLVKTGMAWELQGSYGRLARYLIEREFITPDGEIIPQGGNNE